MARYIPDVRFIASIYPGQLPIIRRHYSPDRNGGSTAFSFDPVPRGGRAFVLPVYDSFESLLDVQGLSAMGNQNVQKPRLPKPVPVETIVADILKEHTGGLFNVPQGATPGVAEIFPLKVELKKFADTGDLPSPTGAEMKAMMATQSMYFEYLFTEGERLHKQNNWKEITDTMRLAADWLGYKRDWSHRDMASDSAPCPWCTSMISNQAIVCPSCNRQVKATPAHLLNLERQSVATPVV
jgi:hypothetical protein